MAKFSNVTLAIFVVAIAAIAGYLYVFGLPAQLKRDLEEKALETMGENKASYMVKSAVGSIPESENRDLNQVKQGLGNALGGSMQNPLGKFAGNTADDATRDLTGR